jgi:2-succinyl-5-enolpyruvyl-6-hydroxy-3-cyclohexene-1-carboxylate synthase
MPENATYTCAGALLDEFVRRGADHLCLCPGSRSAPLAINAARHPGMRTWVLIDERSAGFFALGLAKGLGRPAILLSTSGTAAANFYPAVIEARYGRVPLLVLTADRPRELRDCGTPQTIDQVRLYGSHAKWFVDVAQPEASDDMLRYVRTLACQAVTAAEERPRGPVHLNVPLREPLVPIPDATPAAGARNTAAWEGRDALRPYAAARPSPRAPDPEWIRGFAKELVGAPRGLIVCGPSEDRALPAAAGRLASVLGYPILADPLSQLRFGPHDRRLVIDSYDAMLRVESIAAALAPDVVIHMGATPASRPLLRYLERHVESRHVILDGDGGWNDPAHLASLVVHADPALVCEDLSECAAGPVSIESPLDPEWEALWHRFANRTRRAVRQCLDAIDEPFEGKVMAELCELLPDGSTLYVGNSMPVRDLDTFGSGGPHAVRVLGNRGASGIDGLVSSALGTAAAGTGGGPLALALGDLSLYHDMNGLLAAKLHGLSATIVLLDNDGGGIFSFLPQAAYPDYFEPLFGTPTGLDFAPAAALYGATFYRAGTWEMFRASIRDSLSSPGLHIVAVRTARDRNVLLHRRVWDAVEEALRDEPAHAVSGLPG